MFCRSLEPNRRGDGSTSRRLVRLATVALCLSWTVAAADVASALEPTDRAPSPRASTDAEDASRSTGPRGRAVQWLYVTSLGSASMLAVGYAAYRLALRQGRFDHAPDRVEEREPILGGAGLEDVADSLEQPVGPSEALVAVDRIEGVERGDSATS